MLKVVIVGYGFMGRTHAGEVLASDKLELIAIVDKDIHKILSRSDEVKGNLATGSIKTESIRNINRYTSFEECLENEKPDAVHVCVHTNMHYEIAKMALEKGINVFIEKPLCLDLKQGQDLIRMAEKGGLTMMVGHVVRFMPPYQKLKKIINDYDYGKLEFLYMNRVSGLPLWGQWKTKQSDYGSSGGALFDLVIHDIDFVIYALGRPPDEITASNLPGKLSNHDYVSANWKYRQQNILVRIEGGNIFHSALPFRAGYMAKFENASIEYSTENPETIKVSDNKGTATIDAGKPELGFRNEISYFYECIENSVAPSECMPEASLRTIETCYRHI